MFARSQSLSHLRSLMTQDLLDAAGKSNQDDLALLRFLRARDFNVAQAYAMFCNFGVHRD